MQLIRLDHVYYLQDLDEQDGLSLDGHDVHLNAGLTLKSKSGARSHPFTIFQSGVLTLAHSTQIDGRGFRAKHPVDVLAVWWTKDGMSGTLLAVGPRKVFVTDRPLATNQVYDFSNHFTRHKNTPNDALMAGCWVTCRDGAREVSSLRPGDTIWTKQFGYQSLKTVFKRVCPAWGRATPVLIKQGTLGVTHDLVLPATQHIDVQTPLLGLYLDNGIEVACIGDLVNDATIRRVKLGFATYIVLDCGRPASIEVNGLLVHLDGTSSETPGTGRLPQMMGKVLPSDDGRVVGAML